MVGPPKMSRGLLALNVIEKMFELLEMSSSFTDISTKDRTLCSMFYLVVCNTVVLMVVICWKEYYPERWGNMVVVKMDLES